MQLPEITILPEITAVNYGEIQNNHIGVLMEEQKQTGFQDESKCEEVAGTGEFQFLLP